MVPFYLFYACCVVFRKNIVPLGKMDDAKIFLGVLQPLGTKQVKPESLAEIGVYVPELALAFTKLLKMKSAALIFCAMTITIQPEILQKVLVKPCLCQEAVVVTNQL